MQQVGQQFPSQATVGGEADRDDCAGGGGTSFKHPRARRGTSCYWNVSAFEIAAKSEEDKKR